MIDISADPSHPMDALPRTTLTAMSAVRGLTLGVRFLCELGMLAAFAVWGAHVGDGPWAIALAVTAPVVAAAIWGAFVAPKARWPVPLGARVAIELVLFGVASLGLWSSALPVMAAALAMLALATSVLNAVQEQSGESVPRARGDD